MRQQKYLKNIFKKNFNSFLKTKKLGNFAKL
jgi:hypothetical protein